MVKMAFFKGIWKHTHLKHHQKLSEEKVLSYNPDNGEMEDDPDVHNNWSFQVKYLGSLPLEQARSDEATAQAIKSIFAMAKAAGKKPPDVKINVTLKGIKVTEINNDQLLYDISIFRISYCSADGTYKRIFAFIATNNNNMLECHAFLCPKRKVALNLALTVARAFNVVYDLMHMQPNILIANKSSKPIPDKQIIRKTEEHPPNILLNYNQKYQENKDSSNLLIDL